MKIFSVFLSIFSIWFFSNQALAELNLDLITVPDPIVSCICTPAMERDGSHNHYGYKLEITIYTPVVTKEKISFEKIDTVTGEYMDRLHHGEGHLPNLKTECLADLAAYPGCPTPKE